MQRPLPRRIRCTFFFFFFAKWSLSLSYQAQLAKICSQAIPLEKAINNGRGRGDETSSRHAAELTMKGSPSPLSSACLLFGGCSRKHTWKSVPERMDSRCSGFVEWLGINWGDGCESGAEGQRPERAQLHSRHGRARSATRRLHLVLSVSDTLDLPSVPF